MYLNPMNLEKWQALDGEIVFSDADEFIYVKW